MGKVTITPTKRKIRGIPPGATLQVSPREAKWLVKHRLAELVEEPATPEPEPEPEPPQPRPRSTRRRKVAEPEEVVAPAADDPLDAPHAPDDPDYLHPSDDAEVASTRRYIRRDLTAEG